MSESFAATPLAFLWVKAELQLLLSKISQTGAINLARRLARTNCLSGNDSSHLAVKQSFFFLRSETEGFIATGGVFRFRKADANCKEIYEVM